MLREGVKTVNSRWNSGLTGPSTGADDPRESLVLRIAESRQFARSARLRDFLLYVCRASLDSHPEDINEQKIGERVFHRSPHYNANEDNIVRSHARLLRL